MIRPVLFILLMTGITVAQAQEAYDPSAPSPMDLLASPLDLDRFLERHANTPYLVFTEDRTRSVRWDHALPAHWIERPQHHLGGFSGQAQPGEFYVFQVVVFPIQHDLHDVHVHFDFDLYLTPFKPLDTQGQWALRYIHPHQGINDPHFQDFSLVQKQGANVVNMHHNTAFNPFINYPYNELSLPGLIDCVQRAHAAGLKLKLYYTTREITNNMRELYAFTHLQPEVIFPTDRYPIKTVINPNGPHPWLVEHLGPRGYIPAWHETLRGPYEGMLDLAVITAPDTRWNNFYLEGLKLLVDRAQIDGLYIDDTALDRRSLQRARRILDARRPDPQIDLHSWNHYNGLAQYASCANLYMEIFPYINRIWFGEGFDYNSKPDYWLVEISGIPFGLMGEMLQGGGNPWRGMVYGMTQRLGWSGDPRAIWQLWDRFGMQNTHIHGYWDPGCPVQTGREDVLATVYQKASASLIALASWSKTPESVALRVDWDVLGMDPDQAVFYAPPIRGFQDEAQFKPKQGLPVEPGRGWLLIVKSSHLPQ